MSNRLNIFKIENITDNKKFSCLTVQAPEDSKTEHHALKHLYFMMRIQYRLGELNYYLLQTELNATTNRNSC
jgi:hypothetical protein